MSLARQQQVQILVRRFELLHCGLLIDSDWLAIYAAKQACPKEVTFICPLPSFAEALSLLE